MDYQKFQWINESRLEDQGERLGVYAPPQTDYFCNNGTIGEDGITPESLCNAPFLYREIEGDFVFRVKVSHDFLDTYDSSSIMLMAEQDIWAKACFEMTDFGTHAVVSVVTVHTSDDANGCNLDSNSVWLQAVRVGDSFAFHYSEDGEHYYMIRFFHLPADRKIKVGLLAQAPLGGGGMRWYSNLTIEQKTVKNIRVGK